MTYRSGIGIDVHALVKQRPLILGGITIPFDKGLAGHSDGDVLIHSLIDAFIGGAGLGDIGTYFPSTDPKYKNIQSTKLLSLTMELLKSHHWSPKYIDATILAEHPVLKPFITKIIHNLSKFIGIPIDSINIKATTTDGLGFIGNSDGIACFAIVNITKTK